MMNAKELIARAETLLMTREHIALAGANAIQLHDALASAAMEALAPVWTEREKAREGKRPVTTRHCICRRVTRASAPLFFTPRSPRISLMPMVSCPVR